MVISTAYLDEAERCDRLALLHRGRVMYCDTPQQLKRDMPGAIVRIVTNEPRAVIGLVRALPGVRGSLLVGEGIHLYVDDGARRLPELRAAMQGKPVADISLVEPTIEDLFVALLEQQEAA